MTAIGGSLDSKPGQLRPPTTSARAAVTRSPDPELCELITVQETPPSVTGVTKVASTFSIITWISTPPVPGQMSAADGLAVEQRGVFGVNSKVGTTHVESS
eukprot:3938543-Rhodomonas_salina.2